LLPPHAIGSEENIFGESPEAMAKAFGPTTPSAFMVEFTVLVIEFVGRSQPIRISWAWEEFPKMPRMAKQYAKTHPFGEVKTFISLTLA
jgi:hypothetical protein